MAFEGVLGFGLAGHAIGVGSDWEVVLYIWDMGAAFVHALSGEEVRL